MMIAYAKERYGFSPEIAEGYVKHRLREGCKAIVTPKGFMLYKLQGDACLLYDAYVDATHRQLGTAKEMLTQLISIARKAGANVLITFSEKTGYNRDKGLNAATHCGFKLHQDLPTYQVLFRGVH